MGSQAEYWTDIYATTHEQRLAQSMEAARAELKDRYALEGEYLKWLTDKRQMLEQERTKVQQSLDEYSRTRGGKVGGGGADNTAAILGVIAEAGNTIARETGDAAQRKLEAEAAVISRYNPTAQQTTAIGNVSAGIQSQNIAAVTTVPDLNRIVRQQINDKISAGLVQPGSDQAKTMAAELYAALDASLQQNPVYIANKPQVQAQFQSDIAAKLGVDPSYTQRLKVDSDRKADIQKAQTTVGVTGTKTSKEAADLAKQALDNKLGQANEQEADAVAQWVSSPQGAAYMSELQRSGNYALALEEAAKRIGIEAKGRAPGELEQEVFQIEVGAEKQGDPAVIRDIRSVLQSSGASFDIQKFFDVGFLDLYGRSKTLEGEATKTFGELSKQWDTLRSGVPTEEAVRRRGAEIYEPISPGVGARRRAAAVREEEARMGEAQTRGGVMRRSTGAGTVDDFLASRLTTPAIPEEQRVVAGASAAAVRYGPKFVPVGEWDADADPGWRMYRNVSEKMLRDTSPKGLVQHAADLAGGDPKKRDEILQSYYQWALGEKQGLESRKRETRVETVEEKPKPVDISGIKPEELEF